MAARTFHHLVMMKPLYRKSLLTPPTTRFLKKKGLSRFAVIVIGENHSLDMLV